MHLYGQSTAVFPLQHQPVCDHGNELAIPYSIIQIGAEAKSQLSQKKAPKKVESHN